MVKKVGSSSKSTFLLIPLEHGVVKDKALQTRDNLLQANTTQHQILRIAKNFIWMLWVVEAESFVNIDVNALEWEEIFIDEESIE